MDNSKFTVPARFVNTMLAIAADRHCDVQQLLDDAGIAAQDIENNQPVPATAYGMLHRQILDIVEDEWFGMLSGGPVPKGAMRLLCQTIVHCENFEDLIERANQFFEICKGFKIKPDRVDDGDSVILKASKVDCISNAEFDDLIATTDARVVKSTLSAWQGFYGWFTGKRIPITDVYYNFPEQDDAFNNGIKHNVHYHYNHPFIGLRFNKRYLAYPVVQTEDTIEEFLLKAPYYSLVKKNPEESLGPYVKSILTKSIGHELPNATDVAEHFNMSVTTFHRRLSSEGYSFQTLKNESRMEAAIHYLNRPDLSTSAISDLLGFENPSTFFRSFKKWTGLPPGEYRKKLLPTNSSNQ